MNVNKYNHYKIHIYPCISVSIRVIYWPKIEPSPNMPTISMFYGILIRMFFYDTDKHKMPHILAEFQGQVAVYSIPDGTVLAGEIPKKKHKLVVAWIEIHQEDLIADWQTGRYWKKTFSNSRIRPMNITEIIPKDNFVLYIKMDNGEEGLFDVKPYMNSEAFAPLKDHEEFKRIQNGKYFVEWSCGADLSADTIEARLVRVSTMAAQPKPLI